MTNILIPNQQDLDQKLQKIVAGGSKHFHVIADFDRTLTKAFVDGKPTSSLEGIFDEEGHLGEIYSAKAMVYFNTYYPIEIDPTVSIEKKKSLMHEWRGKVFMAKIEAGITRNIITQAMKSDQIMFRSGYEIFFEMLKKNNIPLLIFSASGLGYEGIYGSLAHKKILSDNVDIIANSFVRNEEGKAVAYREPIIHSYNKGEVVVKDLPIYDEIKNRKNIILIGDSLGDVHMADGFDYQNIIKIGFLAHEDPENRKQYQEKFDIIILNDGPMDEVNKLLKKIVK